MSKEISLKNAGIITLIILIAIMLISGMKYSEVMKNATTVTYEDEISKNMRVALEPGEVFVYSFGPNETENVANVTFSVGYGDNCTIITVEGVTPLKSLCIDEWGNDFGNSNESFVMQEIFFFRPWMLALREGWSWETTTYIRMDDYESEAYKRRYRVMRTELYNSRVAFVVELSEGGVPYEYLWVDYEKRILLKAIGETYYVEIVGAID